MSNFLTGLLSEFLATIQAGPVSPAVGSPDPAAAVQVLIVDSQPDQRNGYRQALQGDSPDGYRILEAESGGQGLDLWQQHRPELVLLSAALPDLDALVFLAQVQAGAATAMWSGATAAVLVIGPADVAIAVQMIKAGAQDYLVQPQLTPETLQQAVQRAIAEPPQAQRLQESRIDPLTPHLHQLLDMRMILKLQESQYLIQQIAETIPGILYIYDLVEQRNVYVNRQIAQILGYTPEQVQTMGENLLPTLMHPQDFAQIAQHIAQFQTLQPGEVLEREYQMQHADGSWRWFHSREVVFSRTAAGLPQQILGICQDVTDRKQSEAALRLTMSRFEQAAAAVNCLIYEWDLQRGTVERTWGLRELVGYAPEEAEPTVQWWGDRIHPEDLAQMDLQEFYRRIATEDRFYQEYRVRHRQGHYLWVEDFSIVVRDGAGQPIKMVGSTTDITSRKQAEAALRESEEHLRYTVELNPQVPWTADPQGRITGFSDRWLALTGLTRAQALGEGWLQVPHPEDAPAMAAAWQHSIQTGAPYDIEHRITLADGSYRWMRSRALPRRTDQGQILGWYGTTEDIDDRKQAEMALRQSEAKFQRLVSNIPGALYRYTLLPDGSDRLIYISPRSREIYEYEPEALQQNFQLLWDMMHPEDVERVRTTSRAALEHLQTYEVEFRILPPSGRLKWISCRSQPSRQVDGSVIWDGLALDITDRKQAALEAQEGKQILDALMEYVPEGITIADAPDVTIRQISRHGQELAGRPLELLEGIAVEDHAQNWGVFYPDGITPAPNEALPLTRATQQGEVVTDEEWVLQRPDGSQITVLCNAGPIYVNGNITGGIIAWRDISDRVQIERDRERILHQEQAARAEAERANRIKDEFLAILSHELRSPLNPILGWTKLMQSRSFDAARMAEALSIIERNAKLQAQLIDDLLDVAKILRGKLSLNVAPVRLSFVVAAALETVQAAAAAKSIRLRSVLPEVGQVTGDAARLQQIIWNLLSNAVKFTPSGGQVEVCLERVADQAQVTVRDSGKGIRPDFLPHIFESFRQEDASTTRRYGGLGLGLAIVRTLVEAHGGTIVADSAGEGLGATFTLCLPLLSAACPAAPVPPSPNLDLTGMRVLAVDDEPDARDLLTALLTHYNAEVMTVAAAAEVLAVLAVFQPDVLVSDVGMPDVDGYGLIRQMRSLPPEQGGTVPAIALTAYAREEDRQQALAAGFQQHVSKPIDPELLVQAIRGVVR